MQKLKKIYIILTLSAFSSPMAWSENIADIKSPNGRLQLKVENDGGTLSYILSRGANVLVEKSKVGLITSAGDFSSGISIKRIDTKDIEETFTLPAAGQSTVTDRCRELTVGIEKNSRPGSVIFRLYDEGMAWRYTVDGTASITVSGDAGEVRPASAEEYLTLPLSQGTRASFAATGAELLECMGKASLPLISRNGDDYLIINETAPASNFCGSRLNVPEKDVYVFTPVESVTARLPLATPWRMITTGSLKSIAAGHIAECLAQPSTLADTSWITPGRAVTTYCGEDHTASYLDGNVINSYIDWASNQGWEYITLDKWWNLTISQLKQVTAYASARNVGVIVWKSRKAFPNSEAAMRSELLSLKQAGAKGIKVEFWEDESLATVEQRNLLLQIAAEQKLLVLLSNTVNTAGLSRTWPNLMGSEAGVTNSSYVFSPDLVGAVHNINAAILHAAGGPVDYYPVDFAERDGKLLQATTHAHQLALAAVFHSGIQHIADSPSNLRHSITKNILKSLPATWDATEWLEAEHNEALMLVRRKGDDYYLAALTADPSSPEIPLSFLPEGKRVNAYIYHDGSCPTDINFEYKTGLTSSSTITLPMAASGGALVRFTSDDGSAKPYYKRYEAEGPDNTIPFGVSIAVDPDGLCSGGAYVTGGGMGRPVTINNISVPAPGNYAVNVYYMASEAVAGSVRLNGKLSTIRGLNFINTGGSSGRNLACITVTIPFENTEGNSLEISSSTTLPAIDRITVTDNETLEYTDGVDEVSVDDDAFCQAYTEGRTIVINTAQECAYTVYDTSGICIAAGKAKPGLNTIPVETAGVAIVTVTSDKATQTHKLIIL